MPTGNFTFGIALIAGALLALVSSAYAQTDNPLIGKWQIRATDRNPGWVGFRRLEFTNQAMFADSMRTPVRYEIRGRTARVVSSFGDGIVYEIVSPDLICLPKFLRRELRRAGWYTGFGDRYQIVITRVLRKIVPPVQGSYKEGIPHDPALLELYQELSKPRLRVLFDPLHGQTCYERL